MNGDSLGVIPDGPIAYDSLPKKLHHVDDKAHVRQNASQALFILTLHMDWTSGLHVVHMRTSFSIYTTTPLFAVTTPFQCSDDDSYKYHYKLYGNKLLDTGKESYKTNSKRLDLLAVNGTP